MALRRQAGGGHIMPDFVGHGGEIGEIGVHQDSPTVFGKSMAASI